MHQGLLYEMTMNEKLTMICLIWYEQLSPILAKFGLDINGKIGPLAIKKLKETPRISFSVK